MIGGDIMPYSQISVDIPSYSSEYEWAKAYTAIDMLKDTLTNFSSAFDYFNLEWEYIRPNDGGPYLTPSNYPYNATGTNSAIIIDTYNSHGILGFITMDHSYNYYDYNLGIIYDTYMSGSKCDLVITLGYIEGRPIQTSNPLSTDISNMVMYAMGRIHTLFGTVDNVKHMDAFKIFKYVDQNMLYLAFGRQDRCIIWSKCHKLGDDNTDHYAIIMCSYNAITDADTSLSASNVIDVCIDNCRIPVTYSAPIENTGTYNMRKFVLQNFVQNGYYFDNIYTYVGTTLPDHFFYNGDEYVKLAYNMLLKINGVV